MIELLDMLCLTLIKQSIFSLFFGFIRVEPFSANQMNGRMHCWMHVMYVLCNGNFFSFNMFRFVLKTDHKTPNVTLNKKIVVEKKIMA